MTGSGGAAIALMACALLVLPDRPRGGVHSLRGRRRDDPSAPPPSPPPSSPGSSPGRRGLVAAAGLAAAGLLVLPGSWWAVLPAAGVAGWWVGRSAGRPGPAELAAQRSWLITHGEVLAACLESGMAMPTALTAAASVAARAPGPPGGGVGRMVGAGLDSADPASALHAVAAMLALGAGADTAWRPADADPRLAGLAGAARRSASGGVTLAQAVRDHVSALRSASAAADRRAAGRSGVVITAPLGLCFLPAFLCLGLAPVVLGLFSGLNLF